LGSVVKELDRSRKFSTSVEPYYPKVS